MNSSIDPTAPGREELDLRKFTNDDFDIRPDTWYANRLKGSRPTPTMIGVPVGDGQLAMGEIGSTTDIAEFMLRAGLLKDDKITRAMRAKNGAPVAAPPPPKVILPAANVEEPESEPATDTPAIRTTTTKAAPREKRPVDYRAIKLDWLKDKPTDPGVLVQFSSDYGDFETYYHIVYPSEAMLYLVFDRRCKFGRFMPKMGQGLVTLSINKEKYVGTLWAAAKFEVGVLEITPFIIAPNAEEEEPLPPPRTFARIPDYDESERYV